MADSLVNGHERPSLDRSASCSSYYSLGMRRKEAGLAARLPVQIYCNRIDVSGTAWETAWDLLSLGYSIIDVATNPSDPWAWAGLVGDLIDVAIPFVGGIGEATRAISAVADVVDSADDIYDAGKTLDRIDDITDTFNTISDGACFIAGTGVFTYEGTVAIESIRAGDIVWAWDEKTGKVSLKEVVETYINEANELIRVFVNGEEIITTPTHPFYSPVKGWTDAVHLRAGDMLVLVNGEYAIVEKVQHEILDTPVTVYNFQVEDYHTYFVGNARILVHNSCAMPKNFSPTGAGRHGAFNQAKRDLGIPASKQPVVRPNIDRRGNIVPGRVYDFDGIEIRDDVIGHTFRDGGYLPPHFNTPDGRHYFY